MATIYFSGSISGGRNDVAIYQRFVAMLRAAGHEVLAGAVASEDVSAGGETLTPAAVFERDLAWLDAADLVVAEVSMPSLGVGYEIAYARYQRGIPVICLYRPAHTKRCSAMLSGDTGVELIEYQDEPDGEARLLESLARLGR